MDTAWGGDDGGALRYREKSAHEVGGEGAEGQGRVRGWALPGKKMAYGATPAAAPGSQARAEECAVLCAKSLVLCGQVWSEYRRGKSGTTVERRYSSSPSQAGATCGAQPISPGKSVVRELGWLGTSAPHAHLGAARAGMKRARSWCWVCGRQPKGAAGAGPEGMLLGARQREGKEARPHLLTSGWVDRMLLPPAQQGSAMGRA